MPTSNDRAPLGFTLWKTAAILAAAGGLLLAPLDNSYRALWYGELQDACHVPLFFVLTLLLAYAWPGRQFAVVAVAAGLAAAIEVVQPLTGRSASWRDLLYGLIGVTLAALWMARSWRWLLRLVLAALLLAWPAWRVGPSLFDAAWAWRSFPELAVSGSPFERCRWYLRDVQTQRLDAYAGVSNPATWV